MKIILEIIIKVILALCVAEIYRVAIVTAANWLDKKNHQLYKTLIEMQDGNDEEKKKAFYVTLKRSYDRTIWASLGVSIYLGYLTIWGIWGVA